MLLLVPSPLSQTSPSVPVLQADLPLIHRCTTWVVENAKPARQAIKYLNMPLEIRALELLEIAKISEHQLEHLLKQATEQVPLALMSDAGCPAVADPGAKLVALAQQMGIPVRPLVGPNSIILGLMGSGLNGQCFQFHGYPPVKPSQREGFLGNTEEQSRKEQCTQIAIETPFRNQVLLEAMLKTFNDNTRLCVASDLTGQAEYLCTRTVSQWKKNTPSLARQPTLFLWQA
ncbi:MAG: SAM-dependent methyltransferase [Limnobacter sp.]|nr:SAM-dependent methyltransferase [Limnobacter sp.]